ncbi:MAG TPA: stalk domain-containing protein, partial [Acetivibrio sp.]|nr:stalk domain-containing protein [Acetivibrio sp.]
MIGKKSFSIILVIALVLGFINPVYARQDEITVNFNGAITMFLDGEEFVPVETDRTYLTPVIYNGRTYLPVRALCDALKLYVDWDASTKTVSIGGGEWIPPQKVTPIGSKDKSLRTGKAYRDTDLKMVLYGRPFNPREQDGTLVSPILVNNRTYLPLRALCDAVGVDVQWDGATSTITMTRNGKGPGKDGEYIHDGSTYEENISYYQDLEPIYNVPVDQVFKFKLKLSDKPFASFGIKNMFKVFSDRDCTTELIANVEYDEESNTISIKPDSSSWGMYPREGVDVKGLSWGGLQKYYIVIYHDLNATEVTELSKPMRLMFTVGSDIPIPTVKVKKDNNGNIVLTWNKIEGAQKYKIYRGSRYGMELLRETTDTSMSMTEEEYVDVAMNTLLSDVYKYAVTSVVNGKESRLSNIISGEDYISIAPGKMTTLSKYISVGDGFDVDDIFSLPKSVSVDYLEYIPNDVPGRYGSYKTSNHKVIWNFSKNVGDANYPRYEGKVMGTTFTLFATFFDNPPT